VVHTTRGACPFLTGLRECLTDGLENGVTNGEGLNWFEQEEFKTNVIYFASTV
jgi:hypothetical protein